MWQDNNALMYSKAALCWFTEHHDIVFESVATGNGVALFRPSRYIKKKKEELKEEKSFILLIFNNVICRRCSCGENTHSALGQNVSTVEKVTEMTTENKS